MKYFKRSLIFVFILVLTIISFGSVSKVEAANPTVPGKPNSVVGTMGPGTARIGWSAPSSDGGSPITDYKVEYKKYADNEFTVLTTKNRGITITGLDINSDYSYRISAVNVVGTGPAVSKISAAKITGLTAVAIGNGQVALTWDKPNIPIRTYTII